MTENLQQAAIENKNEASCVKQACSPDTVEKAVGNENKKRAYVKPTLRKFSQIDYVTAYGVD